MIVATYERDFTLLSRFSSRMIDDEAMKVDFLVIELRPEIKGVITNHKSINDGTTYQLVEMFDTQVLPKVKATMESGTLVR